MDMKRKQQLLMEYRNRRPEMGVIALRCCEEDETFYGCSTDVKADFNSIRFKLTSGCHPNRRLQELWSRHGDSGFQIFVAKELKYKQRDEDHSAKLESLIAQCLAADWRGRRIWK